MSYRLNEINLKVKRVSYYTEVKRQIALEKYVEGPITSI